MKTEKGVTRIYLPRDHRPYSRTSFSFDTYADPYTFTAYTDTRLRFDIFMKSVGCNHWQFLPIFYGEASLHSKDVKFDKCVDGTYALRKRYRSAVKCEDDYDVRSSDREYRIGDTIGLFDCSPILEDGINSQYMKVKIYKIVNIFKGDNKEYTYIVLRFVDVKNIEVSQSYYTDTEFSLVESTTPNYPILEKKLLVTLLIAACVSLILWIIPLGISIITTYIEYIKNIGLILLLISIIIVGSIWVRRA